MVSQSRRTVKRIPVESQRHHRFPAPNITFLHSVPIEHDNQGRRQSTRPMRSSCIYRPASKRELSLNVLRLSSGTNARPPVAPGRPALAPSPACESWGRGQHQSEAGPAASREPTVCPDRRPGPEGEDPSPPPESADRPAPASRGHWSRHRSPRRLRPIRRRSSLTSKAR
ncbi:hypothetical protein NDU88_002772 [Pleurodeles waltl]|uniref:Uncharacterized protein n=1 Tax=Pleurodeles waltl TaxID=8319 RepID=A0AAV7NEM5_PLEWA|nr:hypothetical protein NDU88_002772 [Pleurodeles waltl]